jgi:hypothetical protein
MNVDIEYEIKVKSYGEADYDSKTYYLYGRMEGPLIKQETDELFDYMTGLSLSRDEVNWKLTSDATDSNEITQIQKYADVAKIDDNPTMTEYELEKIIANNKDSSGYYEKIDHAVDAYDYQQRAEEYITELFKYWTEKSINGANTFDETLLRKAKLRDEIVDKTKPTDELKLKEIIKAVDGNSLINYDYLPNETRTELLKGKRLIANGDEIRMENEIEIIKTKLADGLRTGRRNMINLAPLYDGAEWVTITPATGEDRDFVGLTIVGIGGLTVLACGIILIRRYFKRRD